MQKFGCFLRIVGIFNSGASLSPHFVSLLHPIELLVSRRIAGLDDFPLDDDLEVREDVAVVQLAQVLLQGVGLRRPLEVGAEVRFRSRPPRVVQPHELAPSEQREMFLKRFKILRAAKFIS